MASTGGGHIDLTKLGEKPTAEQVSDFHTFATN
jgi:hypothetical protein